MKRERLAALVFQYATSILIVLLFVKEIQAAKPVGLMVASRSTGIKRPDLCCAQDGMLATLATGYLRSGPQATPVGHEVHMRSAAKLPFGHERREYFRCSFGAISVEKMDFMDSMDIPELTPSRGWTEITPFGLKTPSGQLSG